MIGDEEVLLVACEDGKVRIYSGLSSAPSEDEEEEVPLVCMAELVGHGNRYVKQLRRTTASTAEIAVVCSVKALSLVQILSQQVLVTISSDGFIRVFVLPASLPSTADTHATAPLEISAVGSYDTKGSRLTCLSAVAVSDDRTTVASTAAPPSDAGLSSSDSDSENDEQAVDGNGVPGSDDSAASGESDEDSDSFAEQEVEAEVVEEQEEWGGFEVEGA